jgi:hypothetical protein
MLVELFISCKILNTAQGFFYLYFLVLSVLFCTYFVPFIVFIILYFGRERS